MKWLVLSILLSGCGGDGSSQPAAKWQLLAEGRPSSFLAAWASSIEDVWIVGGREGPGLGPAIFHYDGAAWTKLDANQPNVDIWQVFGFKDDAVFLGGSNGTILRYRNGAFTKLSTPSTQTVFGLWGTSPTDVWATGGQSAGVPFVWRLQGDAFVEVPGLPSSLTTGAVWKVTGRASDDVYMSCSRGLVLHWDGQTLSNAQVGAPEESLFSIGCNAKRCVTVGTNLTNGVLYQDDGGGWASRVPTQDGPVWRGVTPVGEHIWAVGIFGAVIRFTDGGWVSDPHELTIEPLHAAWSTPEGELFAVGGKFDRAVTIDGVLLYKGSTELPPLP